jgi:hypothetical protein
MVYEDACRSLSVSVACSDVQADNEVDSKNCKLPRVVVSLEAAA